MVRTVCTSWMGLFISHACQACLVAWRRAISSTTALQGGGTVVLNRRERRSMITKGRIQPLRYHGWIDCGATSSPRHWSLCLFASSRHLVPGLGASLLSVGRGKSHPPPPRDVDGKLTQYHRKGKCMMVYFISR